MSFRALFGSARRAFAVPVPPATPPDDLRRCPDCEGAFVCPIDWETSGEDHWRILTRCGSCGAWRETVISNAQAARLDGELTRDMFTIAREAGRLDCERMAVEVETFAVALARDLIGPDDFRHRQADYYE